MGRSQQGLTLIELMIVIAIVGIISAIAIPIYNGYLQTSREGVLINNISTIEVFQEDFLLRNNTYVGGNYTSGTADASLAQLNWDPRTEDIDYQVVANGAISYEVTATDDTGVSICREYPAGDPC